MSNYRRKYTKGGTYFFTIVMYRRQKILCDDVIRTTLRNAIKITRQTHSFEIDAWVLMPDHLHCIWTLPAGDSNFTTRWAMIKRLVTKQCAVIYQRNQWLNRSKLKRKESTLWQRRFWEHQIRDERDYQEHFDYIHFNPVHHGYVLAVNDWEFSSFHRYVRDGIYPENWGDLVGDYEGLEEPK